MPQQKARGLGKGLGALIPAAPSADPLAGYAEQGSRAPGTGAEPDQASTAGAYFDEVPAGAITPNPRQPRQVLDDDALEELADSIRAVGLLQPVVVRAVMPGHYEIVMGERRWRACQRAGLAHIPAIVRKTSDDDLLRDAQRRVAAGVLSAGHARALLAVQDSGAQEQLARRIVAEGLSVRAVEEIVALGAQPARPARQAPARPPAAPALRKLADRLSDAFETRVKVELGQRKGKIVVEFASIEDLERIVEVMSPGSVQSRSA